MGVLGSYGGSAGRPVLLLPGSVLAPGSGTRYDARVKPGVNKKCGSLLPMWRDAVDSLSVDAAAYDSVLGALSINATVCEYMKLLVAVLGSALLRKCGGDVTYLVSAVGPPFFYATHRRGSCSVFVWRDKRVSSDTAFVTGAFPWRPGRRSAGRRLEEEIAYDNHPSSESHTGAIGAKIVQDVVNGRALVFKLSFVSDIRGSRFSPLGAVEGRKLRIIHDLTFAGHGYRSSVNDDTDFSAAPPCELGPIFGDVCRRIMYLRQCHGVIDRVMLCRIDVKDAFRQIPVDPLHAAKFGYVFDEYAVVDLFLQFRWRSSPA